MELYTIRQRLTSGLLNKAARGELALTLPVGLVRQPHGEVVKDPDREIQDRIALVFSTFLQQRSAAQVLRAFREQGLTLPRRDRFGTVSWRDPGIAAIVSILHNPAYAGAFAYGRTRTQRTGPSGQDLHLQQVPMDEWKICVKDRYPAYITWDIFERIQSMLKDIYAEYDRNKSRSVPRPGQALLQGLVYCGQCGHKTVVQYQRGGSYLCNYLRQQFREPICQHLPAAAVDTVVVQAFFDALSPVELDIYARAREAQQHSNRALSQAHAMQLQRLRYQAALAERQFLQVDPDNRLVAAELERRWERNRHYVSSNRPKRVAQRRPQYQAVSRLPRNCEPPLPRWGRICRHCGARGN